MWAFYTFPFWLAPRETPSRDHNNTDESAVRTFTAESGQMLSFIYL